MSRFARTRRMGGLSTRYPCSNLLQHFDLVGIAWNDPGRSFIHGCQLCCSYRSNPGRKCPKGSFNFPRGFVLDLAVCTQLLAPGAPAIVVSGSSILLAVCVTAMVTSSATTSISRITRSDVFTNPLPPDMNTTTIGTLKVGRGSASDLVIGYLKPVGL